MKLDLDLMRRVHNEGLQVFVAEHGDAGLAAAALHLADALPSLHLAIEVDLLPDGLTAFVASDDDIRLEGSSEVIRDLSSLQVFPHRGFTVQVLRAGYRVLPDHIDPASLPSGVVAYEFKHPQLETWHVGDAFIDVFNPLKGQSSAFGARVFVELDAALEDYEGVLVRECRCLILKKGWLDDSRVFWAQRPEVQIRRSLEQYLAGVLRAVVEVEHIVDEDKEVDVVVFWNDARRGALIECKWMGRSASDPDDDGKRKLTRFGPSDAKSGHQQLADYMDRKRPRESGRSFKGYLVVVDGRRAGISTSNPDDAKVLTPEQLLEYEYAGIDWDEELLARPDLAEPKRMFCRPRLQ